MAEASGWVVISRLILRCRWPWDRLLLLVNAVFAVQGPA